MLSYWLATESALAPAPAVSPMLSIVTALQLLHSAGRGALAVCYRCPSQAGTQGGFELRSFPVLCLALQF